MEKSYNIYYKEFLPIKGDYVRGLFHIKTNEEIIPVEISISGTFLQVWKRGNDTAWGTTLCEIGSLMAELMLLSNNIRNYTFVTHGYPQSFQNGEEGYNLLKTYLEREIEQIKINNKLKEE